MANLYVSTDYNSSMEGWGTTYFGSYSSAYSYATANAKSSTIYIQKNSSVSGFCFDNNHKNYSSLNVVIEDGAIMGNASSKWDMTYDVTVKAGGLFVSARPGSAGYGESHIKNDWVIGEADSAKKATVNFLNYSTYKPLSVSVLYNGRLTMNNAIFKVADFGAVGSVTMNNSEITVGGSIGFGVYQLGSAKTMTNSTMTVTGRNLKGNGTYYAMGTNLIAHLTMDNSTIIIDDGAEGTKADTVELGMDFSKAFKKTLTMKNGSLIQVEKDTEVIIAEKVTLENSRIEAGSITLNEGKSLVMDLDSTIAFTAFTNNGGTITINGEFAEGKLYKLFDYTGSEPLAADFYKNLLGADNYTNNFVVIDNDLYASSMLSGDIYINGAWAGEYSMGDEIEPGKVYGINAFADFTEADAKTAGERTFRYTITSDINAKVTITGATTAGEGALTITGAGDAITETLTAGNSFSQVVSLNAADNKGELVFTVTGNSADYTFDVNVVEANDPEKPIEVGTVETGTTTVADSASVSQHLNAAAYTFTVAANELAEYALDLKNNSSCTVYMEIVDALGNRVFNTSGSSDLLSTIPTLAAGTYTVKVDVPHSANGMYEALYDLYIQKTDLLENAKGGSSAAYIKDSDDTIDAANSAAMEITDWVGKLDSVDWYKLDMSSFAAGDKIAATLEAAGAGVRATLVKVSGGVETTIGNLYTSSLSKRNFAYDGTSEYFVKFTNTSSANAKSVYSMTIASA